MNPNENYAADDIDDGDQEQFFVGRTVATESALAKRTKQPEELPQEAQAASEPEPAWHGTSLPQTSVEQEIQPVPETASASEFGRHFGYGIGDQAYFASLLSEETAKTLRAAVGEWETLSQELKALAEPVREAARLEAELGRATDLAEINAINLQIQACRNVDSANRGMQRARIMLNGLLVEKIDPALKVAWCEILRKLEVRLKEARQLEGEFFGRFGISGQKTVLLRTLEAHLEGAKRRHCADCSMWADEARGTPKRVPFVVHTPGEARWILGGLDN